MCQIYWSIRISKEHQAVKDYLQRKGMTPGEKRWFGHLTGTPSQPGTAQITTTDDNHGVQNFKYNLVEPFMVKFWMKRSS